MSEINNTKEIPEGNFPINLKLIAKYQLAEHILIAKYKDGTYHKGYFRGGSNIGLNLKICEDKIFVLSKLQSYILHWYHMYLLHPGMDRSKAMICQHLY